jgi:hypothetical protein
LAAARTVPINDGAGGGASLFRAAAVVIVAGGCVGAIATDVRSVPRVMTRFSRVGCPDAAALHTSHSSSNGNPLQQ